MNIRPHLSFGVIVVFLSVIAFSQSQWASPILIQKPSFSFGAHDNAPLTGVITFSTSKPMRATVQLQTAHRSWQLSPTPAQRKHQLPVIGFTPDETGQLQINLTLQDGHGHQLQHQQSTPYQAPPLPDNFPPLDVSVSQPDAMEPGLTLFNVMQWQKGKMQEDIGWLVAVDSQGQVKWYYQGDRRINDVERLPNGNLIFTSGNRGLKEINTFGQEINQWFAVGHLAGESVPANSIPVDVDTFHHEIKQLPNGHLVSLATEVRTYPDYPSRPKNTQRTEQQHVVGDQIVEFTRQGEIVQTISLLDILDPYRLSYSSLASLWDNWAYPDLKEQGGTADWAHANAIEYDANDDTYLVSLRHQDAVVKISRRDQSLRWILGNHQNWSEQYQSALLTPTNSTEHLQWPYHQHAPMLTDQGTILLFDNGNFRASPPQPKTAAPDNYSRAVEYQIDEQTNTIDQIWSYGGPATPEDQYYSPFVGDADILPTTKNILITDGGRATDTNGKPTDKIQQAHQWARIIEVTHQQSSKKIFELTINDDNPDIGWTVYRADRVPRL